MSGKGKVVSVNISKDKGTVKYPVAEISIDERGIVGDAHVGLWHRQVSLIAQEDIDIFIKEAGKRIAAGEFAENISIAGIDISNASLLDKFRIRDVELEVAQIGKSCHGDKCAIYQAVGKCIMPKKGIFCRVIKGGIVKPGDLVEYQPKTLRFLIITLSDRASAGEYKDRSGPRAKQILEEHFSGTRWRCEYENLILADEANSLYEVLTKAVSNEADVIFTLGGTGIGPRDITPEVVASVCEKRFDGIMENIRIRFGSAKPSALLSRSIAGLAGRTQIYALPGSVRAVEEYLSEILKTLEHAIYMVHGLDIHEHHNGEKTQ